MQIASMGQSVRIMSSVIIFPYDKSCNAATRWSSAHCRLLSVAIIKARNNGLHGIWVFHLYLCL